MCNVKGSAAVGFWVGLGVLAVSSGLCFGVPGLQDFKLYRVGSCRPLLFNKKHLPLIRIIVCTEETGDSNRRSTHIFGNQGL